MLSAVPSGSGSKLESVFEAWTDVARLDVEALLIRLSHAEGFAR